jgi:hypothetical protein
MCRNIKKLRKPQTIPTSAELTDASLQFIRKISGYRIPSKANQKAFDKAVKSVAAVAEKMFHELKDGKSKAEPT